MLRFEDAQKLISDEIERLEIPATPAGLYEPVRYILSNGGKRLRPTLAVLAANMFGDNVSGAIKPAIGIEIFHNFTLLHDDLMDNAGIRRGNPTVHVKWNPDVAILSGDAMSIMAHRFISYCDEKVMKRVLDIFNQTAIEVCEGQMMDMDFEGRDDVSEDEYIRMIELKTSVLIAASLEIGAITGGAGEKEAAALYDFGRNLGIAFQLQDDYLDTFGDTSTFGKKVGNDIITNKKTYLVITALKEASENDRQRLLDLYSGEQADADDKVREVLGIFNRCNIGKKTRAKTEDYFGKAYERLRAINVPGERKKVLDDFSRTLINRNY
ncbi:MAG TPA: polyprenyl synthetase family protein [Bacteroidales bacterium]|nr:polyprenyl synthetase family protein [Bacteroidales bacterium]